MTNAIELPATMPTQHALHEATAHLYDALAEAHLEGGDEAVPEDIFETIERLYVATAEGSVRSVRISFELEQEARCVRER